MGVLGRVVGVVFGVSVLLVFVQAPAGARVEGGAPSASPSYSESRVVACLRRHGLIAGNLPVNADRYPPSYPPGVRGSVEFFTGFGPKIDEGEMFFFKSHSLAGAGQARLVSEFVYGRGLPPVLRAAILSEGPVALGTASSLHREAGNVVLIWNHPRRHAALSNEIVKACLAASLEP